MDRAPFFMFKLKMKRKTQKDSRNLVYAAPVVYPGLFYIILTVWTVVCVFLMGSRALKVGWPVSQILMIAFVLAYTWYFSLGISYRIMVDSDGNIELTSFRRQVHVNAKTVAMVEGPRLAIVPFGFVRFRLDREKAYLFALITDETLRTILETIRRANPETKFKGL